MNQVLLGASIPFILGLGVYVLRGCRAGLPWLILLPLVMFLGALWAEIPDIPRLLGMTDLYNQLSNDPRCNIFFWHYSIDKTETDSPWYGVGFILMLVMLLFMAWRELVHQEKEPLR